MDIKTEKNIDKRQCILVDKQDKVQGIGSLYECHKNPAKLHRAFSIFLFNNKHELLIQKRGNRKYTFPLHTTNTVCSHPYGTEHTINYYARRRLIEELGIDLPENEFNLVTKIYYKGVSDKHWGEHELDYLYFVEYTPGKDEIKKNNYEIESWKFVNQNELNLMLNDDDILLTPWFRAILKNFNPLYESLKTIRNEIINDFGDLSLARGIVEDDTILISPYSYVASMEGSKKIRSMMVESFKDIYKVTDSNILDSIKKVIEKIHNTSLVLDDIEDRSEFRRGNYCAHKIFGEPFTINAGVYSCLRIINNVNDWFPKNKYESVLKVNEVLCKLHRGQGTEIYWSEIFSCPTEEMYINMIRGKTGILFKSTIEFLQLQSDFPLVQDEHNKLIDLIDKISIFFQIRDDYVNLTEENYWIAKGFCEDLDEQKFSLIIIHFINNHENELIFDDFIKLFRKESKTDDDKWIILNYLSKNGSLNYVFDYLNNLTKTINESLIQYNNPILKQLLDMLYFNKFNLK
jgi:geranylgeranyl diphosphate synthase type 3